MSVEGVGVEGMMTLDKVGALFCETGGQDSMYLFTGASTRFGCVLPPASTGVRQMADPLCTQASLGIKSHVGQ